MRFRGHGDARAEADAAAAFYKEKQPGLTVRFLDNLDDAPRRIERRPLAYRQVEGDVHKCRATHFPLWRNLPVSTRIHRDSRRHALATRAGILEGAALMKYNHEMSVADGVTTSPEAT